MEIPQVKGCVEIPVGEWMRHTPVWLEMHAYRMISISLGRRHPMQKKYNYQNSCLCWGGVKKDVLKTKTKSFVFASPHPHRLPQPSFPEVIFFQHLRETLVFSSLYTVEFHQFLWNDKYRTKFCGCCNHFSIIQQE